MSDHCVFCSASILSLRYLHCFHLFVHRNLQHKEMAVEPLYSILIFGSEADFINAHLGYIACIIDHVRMAISVLPCVFPLVTGFRDPFFLSPLVPGVSLVTAVPMQSHCPSGSGQGCTVVGLVAKPGSKCSRSHRKSVTEPRLYISECPPYIPSRALPIEPR